jgi:hypothetical protein
MIKRTSDRRPRAGDKHAAGGGHLPARRQLAAAPARLATLPYSVGSSARSPHGA